MIDCDVISFNPGKVRFAGVDGNKGLGTFSFVEKRTGKKEFIRMRRLKKWLNLQPPLIVDGLSFHIDVPEAIKWNDQVLRMTYEDGLTLEQYLKESLKNRNFFVKLIKSFFNWCKIRGFLWEDCAPRNIIINFKKVRLVLVDFERGLQINKNPISDERFKLYAQSLVFEEFSAFLLKHEQEKIFGGIWKKPRYGYCDLKAVSSRRKKLLIKKKYGSSVRMPIIFLKKIERLMASVATPEYYKGKIVFPMIFLEKINQLGGTKEYVKAVLDVEGKSFKERTSILKEISSRLDYKQIPTI